MITIVTRGPFDITVEERARPVPGAGEALLRVERIGVCGGDISMFKGTLPYKAYPRIQGHELSALIEELPDAYAGPLAVGDRVAVEPLLSCGLCYPCRIGRPNCCTRLKVLGAHVDGGMRELVALPTTLLHRATDLTADEAALAEPISIAVQATARGAIGPADRVVVMGAGPIGVGVCLAASDRGARVMAVDKVPTRLEIAGAFGAEETVNAADDDVDARVLDWTDGDGPSVLVDAVGAPAVIRHCCQMVASAGRVVIIGLSDQEVSLPVIDFTRKEMTILGSRNNAGLFDEAVDLVRRNRARVVSMITHRYPLRDAENAIRFAYEHPEQAEKVMISVSA